MISKIKIEKGVPLPERHRLHGISAIMQKMEIGDSIVIPASSRSNMKAYANRHKIDITTRAINDKEVRVWRIK
jgi:hypothetical protein